MLLRSAVLSWLKNISFFLVLEIQQRLQQQQLQSTCTVIPGTELTCTVVYQLVQYVACTGYLQYMCSMMNKHFTGNVTPLCQEYCTQYLVLKEPTIYRYPASTYVSHAIKGLFQKLFFPCNCLVCIHLASKFRSVGTHVAHRNNKSLSFIAIIL